MRIFSEKYLGIKMWIFRETSYSWVFRSASLFTSNWQTKKSSRWHAFTHYSNAAGTPSHIRIHEELSSPSDLIMTFIFLHVHSHGLSNVVAFCCLLFYFLVPLLFFFSIVYFSPFVSFILLSHHQNNIIGCTVNKHGFYIPGKHDLFFLVSMSTHIGFVLIHPACSYKAEFFNACLSMSFTFPHKMGSIHSWYFQPYMLQSKSVTAETKGMVKSNHCGSMVAQSPPTHWPQPQTILRMFLKKRRKNGKNS